MGRKQVDKGEEGSGESNPGGGKAECRLRDGTEKGALMDQKKTRPH